MRSGPHYGLRSARRGPSSVTLFTRFLTRMESPVPQAETRLGASGYWSWVNWSERLADSTHPFHSLDDYPVGQGEEA